MIGISSVMFFIATFHMAINAYRMVEGYVDHAQGPGGASAYMSNLRSWHYILKDVLYATQENLGIGAAIYRCWVLWSYNLKIILFPSVLLIVNIGAVFMRTITLPVAGYMVCGLYHTVSSTGTNTVFSPLLTTWIKIFFSLTVASNIVTTSLTSYRIWNTHRQSAMYTGLEGDHRLKSVLRILVESAALQLVVQIFLLALYTSGINAQYIILESIASIGITFNALTIRIKLESMSTTEVHSDVEGATQTIGRMPTRRLQVHVELEHRVEDDLSVHSK
ncbi:hypothetical protein FB446DRAFT_638356 [Lentinula raphanica]|uniref:Uncharacterized protein n=1 Tax=Lentinula raphanica TaxID=153919 RepID=A0AA38PD83_9AGAR|nr:hypothetical protein FB446DRAFT_638356 [Lentinula raphanica]KAJ3840773.1 hypothetical protein F5878DRAFT_532953 [Lentinula raphanica]